MYVPFPEHLNAYFSFPVLVPQKSTGLDFVEFAVTFNTTFPTLTMWKLVFVPSPLVPTGKKQFLGSVAPSDVVNVHYEYAVSTDPFPKSITDTVTFNAAFSVMLIFAKPVVPNPVNELMPLGKLKRPINDTTRARPTITDNVLLDMSVIFVLLFVFDNYKK